MAMIIVEYAVLRMATIQTRNPTKNGYSALVVLSGSMTVVLRVME